VEPRFTAAGGGGSRTGDVTKCPMTEFKTVWAQEGAWMYKLTGIILSLVL